MAIDLRQDTNQFLRYAPEELKSVVRAAEAWGLRQAGARLARAASHMPTEAGDNARHIGHILNEFSDARMEYLGLDKYDTNLEDLVAAGSFDVISRWLSGEQIEPAHLITATDMILSSLKHIDMRTRDAGFLHPTRLESILTRGD